MKNENWLNEPVNQAELQEMAMAIVTAVAPEELGVLDEIFPKYLTIVEDGGGMKGTSNWGQEMAFDGHTSLFCMILLPVLTVVVQKWLYRYDVERVYRLMHRTEPLEVTEPGLVKSIEQTLKSLKLTRRQRKEAVPILVESIVIFFDERKADEFTMYERGLERLLGRLSVSDLGYGAVLTYEQRLLENIRVARLYGDTDVNRSARAAIIGQLNGVAVDAVGVSFNALCVGGG